MCLHVAEHPSPSGNVCGETCCTWHFRRRVITSLNCGLCRFRPKDSLNSFNYSQGSRSNIRTIDKCSCLVVAQLHSSKSAEKTKGAVQNCEFTTIMNDPCKPRIVEAQPVGLLGQSLSVLISFVREQTLRHHTRFRYVPTMDDIPAFLTTPRGITHMILRVLSHFYTQKYARI